MAISWTYLANQTRPDRGARLLAMVSVWWTALRRLPRAAAQRRACEQAQRDGQRVRALAEQRRRSHPGMAADLDSAVDRMEGPRGAA